MILPSLRIPLETPADWLGPLPVRELFERPELPLEVDLGCGKGRFLLAKAAKNPGVNFLGIDRMLRRIRKVDNRARREGLGNIRLLRMEAFYAVSHLIPAGSVSVYYIFFPDPWPKAKHEGHRLFNAAFLDAMHRTMAAGGVAHVATDHAPYFEQLCEVFAGDGRFAEVRPYVPPEEEQTDFERYYIGGKAIGRLSVGRSG